MKDLTLKPLVFILALFVMACQADLKEQPEDSATIFKETYYTNSEKWGLSVTDKAYKYTYVVSCFCMTSGWKYHVEVNKDGSIEKASYQNLEGKVFQIAKENYKDLVTIFDLFGFVEGKIAGEIDDLRVQYDQKWGYPYLVQIDYNFRMADDEISYSVESLSFIEQDTI